MGLIVLDKSSFGNYLDQNIDIFDENSISSTENILKFENTDSVFLSKTNLSKNSVKTRKIKKRNINEEFLGELIKKLISEKPIWTRTSLIERLRKEGGRVESKYTLKVISSIHKK